MELEHFRLMSVIAGQGDGEHAALSRTRHVYLTGVALVLRSGMHVIVIMKKKTRETVIARVFRSG